MDTKLVTAAEFKDLISAVQYHLSSFRSCLDSEESDEVNRLLNSLNNLRRAKLIRRNSDLENRGADWIRLAESVLGA